MRRDDKEISDRNEIDSIIQSAGICRLGLTDGSSPYIVPMNFGYRDNVLHFHSAPAGRKIDILRRNNHVCFEIDIENGIKGAESACSWSIKYESVMGEGIVEFIDDVKEKLDSLNIIMEHYSDKKQWNFDSGVVAGTTVFRVFISSISCKANH